jgi:glycosyltransferase involved in cell wall biosynthesis
MVSGRPVIAYGSGGATETVRPGVTGAFFDTQTVEAVVEAVQRFQVADFDPKRIAAHARRFSREHFISQMRAQLDEMMSGATGSHCHYRNLSVYSIASEPNASGE